MKELKFQLRWRTETLTPGMLQDASLRNMKPACGKRQLNPPITGLAMCFHPTLMYYAMPFDNNKENTTYFNNLRRQENQKKFQSLLDKVYESKRVVAPAAAGGSAAPPALKAAARLSARTMVTRRASNAGLLGSTASAASMSDAEEAEDAVRAGSAAWHDMAWRTHR